MATSQLLSHIVCPNCWERYPTEDVVWVAEHAELRGDDKLGPDAARRFMPSRFTPEGDAIDPQGRTCHQLACGRCHLPLPRPLIELDPIFMSVLGTPGSGKSYFLTAAMWKLREILAAQFAVGFADAEPAFNQSLVDAEENLFLNSDPDKLVWLGSLIDKTDAAGADQKLYNGVTYGTHAVTYLRPYLFTLQPLPHHPSHQRGAARGRVLCLYDNAGEHFLPGSDSAAMPVARHVALSQSLMFLYDPTQDPRFREACVRIGLKPPKGERDKLYRQETTLNEAAARVRKYSGMAGGSAGDRLLIVVVSKYDTWAPLLGLEDRGDPWRTDANGVGALDVERIENVSAALKRILANLCPEIVGAAQGFSRDVIYLPSSALGEHAEIDPATGKLGIRPRNVAPVGVAIPFLYALQRTAPGLIPRLRRKPRG